MINFSHTTRPALSTKVESVVIFIHGYGADGNDLLALGEKWAPLMPHTEFIAPNAPYVCGHNPFGFEWFNLKDWDPHRIVQELNTIEKDFQAYLDRILQERNLESQNLALVGFSQGTILALHMALHRPLCAGVIGYSGAYLHDISRPLVALPPALLVHGEDDTVLSREATIAASKQLKMLGIDVEDHVLPQLGHTIDGRGLAMGVGFLKEKFGIL